MKVVGFDWARAYKSVVAEWALSAGIVFDKFHLFFTFNHALDEIRACGYGDLDSLLLKSRQEGNPLILLYETLCFSYEKIY